MTTSSQPIAGSSEPTGHQAAALLRIETVALRTGLTKRTLRYYEEIGLLEPPSRTEGGYRLYSPAEVLRLERIKRLRDLLGFSLSEIRDLVRAEEDREQVRSAWRRETDPAARLRHLDEAEALVRRQLHVIEEKLIGLQEMRDTLLARLTRYDQLREEIRARNNADPHSS